MAEQAIRRERSKIMSTRFAPILTFVHIIISIHIFMLLSPVCLGSPDEAVGITSRVIEGNVIEVEGAGTVMLADIECQDLGTLQRQAARLFAADWLERNAVHLDIDDWRGTDSYGRLLAVVYIEQLNGTLLNFNKMMVEMGHACIQDSGDNEFSPADWWGGGQIPARVCIKGQMLPKAAPSPVTCGGPYIGSMKPGKFRKFHYPTCRYAKRIKPADQVVFNNAAEARAYGFIPCMICHPL